MVALAAIVAFGVSSALAANLIVNGTFESEGAADSPEGWIKGQWGTNSVDFEYPADGVSGSRAAGVTVHARTSGDAKWAHSYVDVVPGSAYTYTDLYMATVPTILTVEYELGGGAFAYDDLATVPAAASFESASATFTPPSSATRMRVFHLINEVGSLTIDNAMLEGSSGPPPDTSNLVPNPSMEGASNGQPVNWGKGRWGTNTAQFVYPIAGFDGVAGGRVVLTSHTSGDAKWYFDAVPASAGTYEFRDWSKATVPTEVTVEMRHSDGSVTYEDIGTVAAASDWHEFTASFDVPGGVTSLSVFHVINVVGSLDVDLFTLKRVGSDGGSGENPDDPTLFDKGYVTLTFDDGYRTDYDVVFPRLESAGFTATHFIVTGRMFEGTFPGFIKVDEILDLQAHGFEIGAHTRTHPDLTAITASAARDEIEGSRQDLLDIGASPVHVFAYPFGSYNPSVQSLVRNAGFVAARSSDGGFNKRNSDKYALKRMNMTNDVTAADAIAAIDQAREEDTWLIFLFHRVDTSGETFTTTPAIFEEIISYLETVGMTPITVSEGVAKMQ